MHLSIVFIVLGLVIYVKVWCEASKLEGEASTPKLKSFVRKKEKN